jgi:hypothetical protein
MKERMCTAKVLRELEKKGPAIYSMALWEKRSLH